MTPNDWVNLQLEDSVVIKQDRYNKDTLHFWIKAVDIMGNIALANLSTRIDITPPTTRWDGRLETTPPPNASVTFVPETNKPIKGIPHFTSR